MNAPAEPSLAALPNPLLRYFAATRPAFLSVTFVGCLLGLASAAAGGVRLDPLAATITTFFALVAHAAVNVLNDYFDAQNGTDAANLDRIFPFTGGSRFIQNGVMSVAATGVFGYALLFSVIPAGLWLTASSAPGLVGIGICGLFIGWAYSAPPLHLVSRGLGEFCVTAGWVLIVVGTDFVQRRGLAFAPLAAGLGFALLVANLLYINQFPDARADAKAGKRTLVVRLGPARARWGYVVVAALCGAWLAACIAAGALPKAAALALLPLAFSAAAAHRLWRCAERPAGLAPAIKMTILAAIAHGAVLAGTLALS
ncbi:MAG TPA: prenyltransferase [Rhodocyclaceae bacterium]